MVTEASGKEGLGVYTRNRGGHVKRLWVIPTNTITPKRTALRNFTGAISKTWALITQHERNLWNQLAETVYKSNSLAHRYRPSGYNLYTHTIFNQMFNGVAITTTPLPYTPCRIPSRLIITSLSPVDFRITVVYPDGSNTVQANTALMVSATLGGSAGITYQTTRFNIIAGAQSPFVANNVTILAPYSATWGAPVSGQKIFVHVKTWSLLCAYTSPRVQSSAIVI